MAAASIAFSGEYDLRCKEYLRGRLETLHCEPDVVIDFRKVTQLDATCVTELVRMHLHRSSLGFDRETIVVGDPAVHRFLDLLKMQLVFSLIDASNEAEGSPS
jgi:anti-anti-sigma regulatory factor